MTKFPVLALICGFLSACTPTKWVNYDLSKNNQQSYDLDAANCDMEEEQTFAANGQLSPFGFHSACLKSKGWKEAN